MALITLNETDLVVRIITGDHRPLCLEHGIVSGCILGHGAITKLRQ